jgi:phosphoadenosine phosphosulfate reductase
MIDEKLIQELDAIKDPGPLMKALFDQFGKRCAIGTSGQLSGSALIDMAVKAGVNGPRVFTNDTYRLFPETYELFDAIEEKYHLKLERFTPPQDVLDNMVKQYGESLFFDSKERQELCCHVRKVLPNLAALNTLDVWIQGLRADQSAARAGVKRFEIIEHEQEGKKRPVLKVSPLADWKEAQVRQYLKDNNVPVHKLLEKELPGGWRYESLGCVICTTPIGPHEPRRAGRWRWFNQSDANKECGLHLPHSGDKPADKK